MTAPNRREQQKAETRQSILEAAIDAFARLGYDGTNFREITQRCGADRPLILYHFKNKESLWKAAAEQVELRFSETFESLYQPEKTPLSNDRERIQLLMSAFIDTLIAVPAYGQIMLREGASEGPRMEWLARHFAPIKALRMELDDADIVYRVQRTILRDILGSVMVSFVTLGPLMDRSLALVTGSPQAGIHPLGPQAKQAFIDYLLAMVFRDDAN
ncbi:AcrR family transcriptional regulator [Litorivivens lipolytica]|uniref:AcrR family transcriptional regulator n=1 Tax=Litorivivens lipolytica TaxID=1524264 RepID=A0A7W4W4V3_9GAMM|nr:TetR/AcrR family transcriptional regulator [Litorivivens lipolytica]MBB3046934.1 AcrR family transcriptional regulator [Litorivivens lipolytica]